TTAASENTVITTSHFESRTAPLAILGGQPAFESMLHVGRPNLGEYAAFQARMRSIWEANWLTNDGPFVKQFEREIAACVGVEHCICMSNATVALEIAIR